MKQCVQECLVVVAFEDILYFSRQVRSLLGGPLGQETRMDHEIGAFAMMQWLSSQPFEQLFPIFRSQHVVDSVFWPEWNDVL